MPTFLISDLAERVDAQIEGRPDLRVSGVAPLGVAGPEDLAFLVDESSRDDLGDLRVGALLVATEALLELPSTTVLRVADPRLAFARLLPLFFPDPEAVPGLHATVVLGREVELGDDVTIEAHTVVEDGAVIGAGSRIGPCTRIGRGARLGQDCRIAHSVSILPGVGLGDRVRVHEGTRIGTEGFAYVPTREGAEKIPQVGGCVIGDDVEIGANCTIDRGALGDTSIGARTKIDNLVHLAHNVVVGEDCLIVAQVGVAGSVTVGVGAQLGGQAGISGHLTIGAGARIAAQSGVMRDVPAGETHGGYPAQRQRNWMRMNAAAMRLPQLVRRLNAIERRLGLSEENAQPGEPDSEPEGEGASE